MGIGDTELNNNLKNFQENTEIINTIKEEENKTDEQSKLFRIFIYVKQYKIYL